jgi:hypothetical protein
MVALQWLQMGIFPESSRDPVKDPLSLSQGFFLSTLSPVVLISILEM